MYWLYNLTGPLVHDGGVQATTLAFEAHSSQMTTMRNLATAVVALAPLVAGLYINGSVIAPCDSPIYCHGEILKQIELARPFSDSKTFVDMYGRFRTTSARDASTNMRKQ
jgi:alpha,alpha-trehalase